PPLLIGRQGFGREQFGLERLDVSSSTRLTAERLSRTGGVRGYLLRYAYCSPLTVQPRTWVTYVPGSDPP
ncbi:MAG: hypothetical protein PVH34_08145, partial [Syntrophobacterales bacterium]